MLSGLWNDFRFSARTLARNPAFAIAAIVTVALGVGVNTGIFTVFNGVLFRNLPAPHAGELVSITQTIEGTTDRAGAFRGFSTAEYAIYNDRAQTLSGIAGSSDVTRTTLGGERPEDLVGTIVTCNYFDVLEQPPALGRALTAQDCNAGANPVVVLAHGLWATRFGGDPNILGSTVELNRHPFTVVGVASEGTFSGLGLYETGYFAPISAEPLLLPDEQNFGNERSTWLWLLGRRDASLEQVRAELAVLATQIDRREPGRSTTVNVERATPLGQIVVFRRVAMAIGGVVMTAFALVLLIACANVANLVLARATARTREIAVRLSLGASRARVIRQLLVESAMISVAGGALGSVLAVSSFQVLISLALGSFAPAGIPPLIVDASPDLRVLAFTLALTFLTGILFGLAPALKVSRPDLHTTIKQDSPGGGSRRGGRLQGILVGSQAAMCMVLVIATALLLRGLSATQTIDPGFGYEDVAVATYNLESAGYGDDEAFSFQQALRENAGALPGVEGAALAMLEPLRADESESTAFRLPGRDQFRVAGMNVVSPDYFDVVGIPIVRGRTFEPAELDDTSSAIIVTETTARNLWPGQNPVGQTLSLAIGRNLEVAVSVVGVAKDAQVSNVGIIDPYYVYLPANPRAAKLLRLLVKSRADFASTAAGVRATARTLDAGLFVRIDPLASNLDYWRNLSGMVTALAAALGLLALSLASVGIYGVVSYFVSRSTQEMGIRMALGARGRDVLVLILMRTMRPVVVGAVIGLAAAVAVSGVLSSVLFGISPFDPVGMGGAALAVLGIALAAGVVPGRRAARTQPSAALHYE